MPQTMDDAITINKYIAEFDGMIATGNVLVEVFGAAHGSVVAGHSVDGTFAGV